MNQWNVLLVFVNFQLKDLSRSCGAGHHSLYSSMRSVFKFFIQKKGTVFLCTVECMWENGNIVPVILNLSTSWNEWSGFHHCNFIPGGKASVTYWGFLDILGRWKISCPCQKQKNDSSYIHVAALSLFSLYYLGPVFYKRGILSWH